MTTETPTQAADRVRREIEQRETLDADLTQWARERWPGTPEEFNASGHLERIRRIVGRSEAACAEMREALDGAKCNCDGLRIYGNPDFVCSRCRALSYDCGKDWMPKAEVDAMRKNRDECADVFAIDREHEITGPIKDCGCPSCNLHHKHKAEVDKLLDENTSLKLDCSHAEAESGEARSNVEKCLRELSDICKQRETLRAENERLRAACDEMVRACGSCMNWMEQVSRAKLSSATRGILTVDMGMCSSAIFKAKQALAGKDQCPA